MDKMQKVTVVEVRLSGNRSIRFTAVGQHVQVVATGHVDPREISETRPAALQRLADEAGAAVRDGGETWTPRADPGRPKNCRYNTRLAPAPGNEGRGHR